MIVVPQTAILSYIHIRTICNRHLFKAMDRVELNPLTLGVSSGNVYGPSLRGSFSASSLAFLLPPIINET